MTAFVPAAPETFIVGPEGERTAVIIAWQWVTGNYMMPVFDIARTGILKQEAIQHPDGTVSHPDSKGLFNDVRDWVSYAHAHNLAEITEEVKAPAKTGPKPRAKADAPEDPPDPNRPIVFGTKTFKTKSFWHWPTANAVFEIEGEQSVPDDPRVLKVKRDEWYDFKRAGAVEIDPHAGTILESEPAAEPVDETEDDDMDVV